MKGVGTAAIGDGMVPGKDDDIIASDYSAPERGLIAPREGPVELCGDVVFDRSFQVRRVFQNIIEIDGGKADEIWLLVMRPCKLDAKCRVTEDNPF